MGQDFPLQNPHQIFFKRLWLSVCSVILLQTCYLTQWCKTLVCISVFPSIISEVLVCRRETLNFSGTMAVCDDRLHIFVFKFHIWKLLDECCLVLVTSWHLTCLFIFSLIFSVCLLIDLVPLNDLVQRMQWVLGIKHFQQERIMHADIWASLAWAYTWTWALLFTL